MCEMSESDTRDLRDHGLELDGWDVKCPKMDDCKAAYILREIRKVERKRLDRYSDRYSIEQLREMHPDLLPAGLI